MNDKGGILGCRSCLPEVQTLPARSANLACPFGLPEVQILPARFGLPEVQILPARFGLPDRIRTYDLKSRSLVRYPATLRAGIVLNSQELAIVRELCGD